MVQLAPQEQLVLRVQQGRREHRDQQGRRDQQALRVLQEELDPPAQVDLLVLLDQLGQPALRVQRVEQEQQVRVDLPARQGEPERLGFLDQQDLQVRLVHRVQRDLRVRAVQQDQPDPPVLPVQQDQLVKQARQGKRAHRVQAAQLG